VARTCVRCVVRVVAQAGVPVRVPITVVTPTIPERRELLHELGQCIARQTAHPYEWIVRTDWDQAGPAVVSTRWWRRRKPSGCSAATTTTCTTPTTSRRSALT
jgi:hypothetical protein